MSTVLCTVKPGKAVAGLVLTTQVVSMDEPCLGLSEVELQSPGSQGFHRYQVLAVVRGGRISNYMRDLGPAQKFVGVHQFRVPGGILNNLTGRMEIVHTVGELYDIADYLRAGYSHPPEFRPSDLYQDLLLQEEEKARCVKRASTFSRPVKIQRS